jgi:hypothetical protein
MRLDLALAKAVVDDIFTDEVNTPSVAGIALPSFLASLIFCLSWDYGVLCMN